MNTDDLERARAKWRYRGGERPAFAEVPGEGQESVWDYPRPPRIDRDEREVMVVAFGVEIARSSGAVRVLETASPPTFYLPPADVRSDLMAPTRETSWCEWKGQASYFDVRIGGHRIERAAWCYAHPFPDYLALAGWIAFYPGKLDCRLAGERVRPQPGGLYGGWVTGELVGPFKGAPGTADW